MSRFPSPAEVEASTQATRDRAIDVIRIVSLVGVVVGHTRHGHQRPLENNPLPHWDGGFVSTPGGRSAAVGTLLCLAGAATLASVRWGLKDQGLYCVAVMLVALVAARVVASDNQRVCAASLPARMT